MVAAAVAGAGTPFGARADIADNAYVFERRVVLRHGDGGSSEGRIDCYKRGAFVLEAKKVGAGDTAPLSARERNIHEKGLVAVLKSLHDELDAAVLDACGWGDLRSNPSTGSGRTEAAVRGEIVEPQLIEQTLLQRLVALDAERRAEEAHGRIRWLRPEFQHPQATQGETATATQPRADSPAAQSEAEIAASFSAMGHRKSRLPEISKALEALGRARRMDDNRWMG